MVESIPSIIYDAIEVYQQQGLSETSGHVMLLQAEINKKKQAAKEEMAKYDIDLGSLARGEVKTLTACTSYLTMLKACFMT
jgi:hypothetical protein